MDLILVVGAKNSSNSNRLRDLSVELGTESYLIDDASKIDLGWFKGVSKVGLTSGASAPEVLVEGVIEFIRNNFGNASVDIMKGLEENVLFPLPKELRG